MSISTLLFTAAHSLNKQSESIYGNQMRSEIVHGSIAMANRGPTMPTVKGTCYKSSGCSGGKDVSYNYMNKCCKNWGDGSFKSSLTGRCYDCADYDD